LAGENLGDLVIADETQFHQGGTQPAAVLPLVSHGLLELIGSDQVLFDQDFAKTGRHNKNPRDENASKWKVTEESRGLQEGFGLSY
jgi:hypothetical protein